MRKFSLPGNAEQNKNSKQGHSFTIPVPISSNRIVNSTQLTNCRRVFQDYSTVQLLSSLVPHPLSLNVSHSSFQIHIEAAFTVLQLFWFHSWGFTMLWHGSLWRFQGSPGPRALTCAKRDSPFTSIWHQAKAPQNSSSSYYGNSFSQPHRF